MDDGENEHAAGFVPAHAMGDLIGRPPHPGIVREKREDMDHPIPIVLAA